MDMRTLTVITNDYSFAEIDKNSLPVPYGTAGDCFSANTSDCRRGHFMMDLSGTGLRVKEGIRWRVDSDTSGIRLQDFRNQQGIVVSAKCGGWCGQCRPYGPLRLQVVTCKVKSSM